MSRYNFVMRDYHAVKEADIEIAGLTVVGGVNGCGKSTIARWLNYVVNVLNNYEKYVLNEARLNYRALADVLSRATSVSPSLRLAWSKQDKPYVLSGSLDEVNESYKQLVGRFADAIVAGLSSAQWKINRRRLSSLFNLEESESESLHGFINRAVEYLIAEGDKIYNTAMSRLENHTFKNWKDVLLDRIDLSIDNSNINLCFSEDGAMLLGSKVFSIPLMLRNAVYINTQEITASIGPSFYESGDFWQLLQNKSNYDAPKSCSLAKMIRKIIGGDVVLNKQPDLFTGRRDRLHYVRQDGLDILLRGAATGIISFSILLQLLENGWITENTLLIIDEPEAHLHPQWIVEYARILVKINKLLGTKIFVSTHNPDMLAALQAISEKEGTLPETLFYLADKTNDGDRYIYRNLGQDIGPIFDSFNIALDRIQLYGPSAEAND